jgi:hypothetical protein
MPWVVCTRLKVCNEGNGMTIGNEVRASIKGTKGNRMFPEAT